MLVNSKIEDIQRLGLMYWVQIALNYFKSVTSKRDNENNWERADELAKSSSTRVFKEIYIESMKSLPDIDVCC